MCKGVCSHHGLVGLDHKAGCLTNHATGSKNVLCFNADFKIEVILAGFQRHDHFFKRTVSGTFTQTIDSALHLSGTANFYTGKGIGNSHAQIVMTMHRPNGFVAVGNTLTQVFNEFSIKLRDGVADGIGHIDGCSTLLDNRLEHTTQEVGIGTVTIFGTKLNVGHEVASKTNRELGLLKNLIWRHAQLFFHVQRTGR